MTAKVLLVFCGLGPLVGLVILAVGAGVLTTASGLANGFWMTPFLLLYGTLFAHVNGIVWALAAGSAAAVLGLRFPQFPTWIGPASGAASLALAALTGNLGEPLPPSAEVGQARDGFQDGVVALMAAAHVGAATLSWLVARPWLRQTTSARPTGA